LQTTQSEDAGENNKSLLFDGSYTFNITKKPPSAPTNLTLVLNAQLQLVLTWDVSNLGHYDISDFVKYTFYISNVNNWDVLGDDDDISRTSFIYSPLDTQPRINNMFKITGSFINITNSPEDDVTEFVADTGIKHYIQPVIINALPNGFTFTIHDPEPAIGSFNPSGFSFVSSTSQLVTNNIVFPDLKFNIQD
jgi:hypothetical protein